MNGIYVLVVCVCIVALLGGIEFIRYSRVKRIINAQNIAIGRIQQDMHALCAGAISVGKHIDTLEQRIRRLAERQDQAELRDPLEQTYSHAIRLAQKGVNVNELVESCGLARGEAELLLRGHRTQGRQTATA